MDIQRSKIVSLDSQPNWLWEGGEQGRFSALRKIAYMFLEVLCFEKWFIQLQIVDISGYWFPRQLFCVWHNCNAAEKYPARIILQPFPCPQNSKVLWFWSKSVQLNLFSNKEKFVYSFIFLSISSFKSYVLYCTF